MAALNTQRLTLKVCIVGAGPAGLAVARAFRAFGIAYEQFERHLDVGGIWDIENPGSPMYRSAHFISSKTRSAFHFFPMPEDFAVYPTRLQVLEYIRSYARAFDLHRSIRFGTSVTMASRTATGWRVTLSDGTEREYSHLVCANGHTWDPIHPAYPGVFKGQQVHAVQYRDAELFRGKRVLVVGGGNSACDIACDAARSADRAWISLRRGYHFIPKTIFGRPTDEFNEGGLRLPLRQRQFVFQCLVRLMTGDVGRLGLPRPDHRILESHPIINDQLIHHLRHGDIAVKGDIAQLDGEDVVFKDGSRLAVELILFATGYKYSIPYVDHSVFSWTGTKPDLSFGLFNANDDRIFPIGFTETNAGGYHTLDDAAVLVANCVLEQTTRSSHWHQTWAILCADPDLSGGIRFVDSERHKNYVDNESLLVAMKRLSKRLRWPTALEALRPPSPDHVFAWTDR